MKTRTEIHTSTHEATIYGCDSCDFEAESAEDIVKHNTEIHVVRHTRKFGSYEWIWFETDEDQKTYMEFNGILPGSGWKGPGWYSTECEEEPCGRGCCSDWRTRMYTLDYILAQNRGKLQEAQQKVEEALAKVDALAVLVGVKP